MICFLFKVWNLFRNQSAIQEYSAMVCMAVIIGTIFLLGSQLAEALSSNCRCKNDKIKSRSTGHCDLIPTEETVELFSRTIKNREKVFLLLDISFVASDCERQISNSQNDCNQTDKSLDQILFPYLWTWIYKGENGMFPLMTYPYDYEIHSLWTLVKTKVPLNAVLEIPDNCVVTVGNISLFRKVFQSLKNMTRPIMKSKWKSYLCYNIDNTKSFSNTSLLIHRFFGFVRGIAVKYCCQLKEMTRTELEPGHDKFCSGEVVQTTMLMDIANILGALLFYFCPLIICFLLKEEPPACIFLPGSPNDWINTDDGVFCLQHLLRWITWWDHPSLIASRIRRILFVILSPFIIYYHIISEYLYMKDIQKEYIKRNIPLGIKGIPFGFDKNYKNTEGFLGGTLVWLPLYFSITTLIICIPKNIGDAITGRLSIQRRSSSTFLIFDKDTLKKYSSIDISDYVSYRSAFETMRANLLLIIQYKFWIDLTDKWKTKIGCLWKYQNRNILIMIFCVMYNICLTAVYLFLFFVEACACFFYYSCPIIFTYISINVNIFEQIDSYWSKISERYRQVPEIIFQGLYGLSIILTWIFLFYIFILTCYIYLCSFFVLNLTIIFTVTGIIITPEYISYLAYVASAMFYINNIYKTFTDKYTVLLNLVAKTPSVYVISSKNLKFIRQEIFYIIVEKIRPLRSELLLLLSKFFVLFLYLSMSYNIIQQYELSIQYTEKILSCFLITQVPKIVIDLLTFITKKSLQSEINEQKKVKAILKDLSSYSGSSVVNDVDLC